MSNLPAGFFITSLNGQRCTAVPKTLVAAGAATSGASDLQQGTTTSSGVQSTTQSSTLSSAVSITNDASSPSITIASVAEPTSTSIPIITSPPIISTSSPETQASSNSISSSARPASKGTTPTTSSSTPLAIPQNSEVHTSPTPSPVLNGSENALQSLQSLAMSMSSAAATPASLYTESAGSDTSPNTRLTAAPVVGGVLGAVGAVAGLAVLFWFLKRRRAGRQSLLTPLSTGRGSEFYGRDNNAGAQSTYSEKWRAEVGSQQNPIGAAASQLKATAVGVATSLKSKLVRNNTDTPNVNLNRGNSQFLDGPIPQHSRNNSVLSGNGGNLTVKDRLGDWLDRVREKFNFNQRLRKSNDQADPFEAARGMTEEQARLNNPPPDFSQLLGMDDRELQLQAERRRAVLDKTQSGASLPPLGSLGLNFGPDDPFADPIKAAGPSQLKPNTYASNPFADPVSQTSDPFADPISQPRPSIPRQNTYITDIRRSRGQSVDATNGRPSGAYRPPSNMTGAVSRYPSSIAPSRDSYRDTVFSSFSGNARKGKGRSDPFDLERPELWHRNNSNNNFNGRNPARQRGATMSGGLRDSEANLYPSPLTTNNLQNQGSQRIQSNATYASKYSSGVSNLTGWGDPGPDLGPGSTNSSMRGNASSSGGSGDFSANGGAGAGGYGGLGLDASKERERQLADGNVSPISFESRGGNEGSVGKAM